MQIQQSKPAIAILALIFTARAWSGGQQPEASPGHVIFLLDTSVGMDKLHPRNVELIQKLLKEPAIKHYNVLAFDVAGRWLEPKGWLDNNEANRKKTIKVLEDIWLEGASDLGAGLDALSRPGFPVTKETPVRVYFFSDGKMTWGETDIHSLVERLQTRCAFPVQFTKTGPKDELRKALLAYPQPADKIPKEPARAAFLRFLDKIDPRVKLLEGKNGAHVKELIKLLSEEDYEWPVQVNETKIPVLVDIDKDYRQAREKDPHKIAVYLAEAERRAKTGDASGAVRALSSVADIHSGNADAMRSVGYRLLDLKQPAAAIRLFERVQRQRPHEPHSFRDLARSLEDAGKYGLAAFQYEIVLAGTWNAKFTTSLKEVVLEEYAHMMRHAIRQKGLNKKLVNHFGERLEGIDAKKLQADLRVTISWNTDDTDVDLWVIEPDGTKCYYAHRQTKNGGELTQDVTQGYGPERYQMIKAKPGEYRIVVHYYSGPRNPQIAETHVNVVVRRDAGTPKEVSQRFTVILRQRNDQVEVCKMKF